MLLSGLTVKEVAKSFDQEAATSDGSMGALRLLMDSRRLRDYEVDSFGAPIAAQAEHLVLSELRADILSGILSKCLVGQCGEPCQLGCMLYHCLDCT